jgi:hypothetical protein
MNRRHTRDPPLNGRSADRLANWNEKGHDPTGNREVLTVREMSVDGGSQTRIQHAHKQNFKPGDDKRRVGTPRGVRVAR